MKQNKLMWIQMNKIEGKLDNDFPSGKTVIFLL